MKKPELPSFEIQIFWRGRGSFTWQIVDGESGATLEKGVGRQSLANARLEAASVLRGIKDD